MDHIKMLFGSSPEPEPYFQLPVSLRDIWGEFTGSKLIIQALTILMIICGFIKWVCLPYVRDFFTAEYCQVELENSEPLKAGTKVVYIVSGFLRQSEINLGIDAVCLRTKQFFNFLTAKVLLNDEPVAALKYLTETDLGVIRIIFTADKSGTYNLTLRFNGFLLPGCPLELEVPPDSLSVKKTEVNVPSLPVILTDGMPKVITIYPRDSSGQPCKEDGVQLDKFDFHASTEKTCMNAYICRKVCELIGGFWKEGLDASFVYRFSDLAQFRKRSPVIEMRLRSNRSPNSYGIFEGQISYDCQLLECFPIVSLTREEYEKLEPTLTQPKHTDVLQLKGELVEPLVVHDDHLKDPKGFMDWYRQIHPQVREAEQQVHINISLKFICVKEVVWTVLLSRTALFRIQGSTRIDAAAENEERKNYIVKIHDDCGNEVCMKMDPSSTRMLMALFLKFRSCDISTERTFTEKCEGLLDALRSHSTSLLSNMRGTPQRVTVSRPDLLRTSLEATKQFEKLHWYSPFVVLFLKEPVGESSWLEWSELLLDTALENNPNGLFCKISERSGFIHPNTSRNYRRWPGQYYELTGKVIGKILVERAMNSPQAVNCRVRSRFSRSFLLQLIGSTPTADTLEWDMPELYDATVNTLKSTNFNEGSLSFLLPVYDSFGQLDHMEPLIDNGENIMVTHENSHMYLNQVARYHLCNKIKREMTAFRAGFISVVPEDLLLNFDENELEFLMCGWSKVDVNDIRNNFTSIGDTWHPEFPRLLKWFWNSLDKMSEVEQAQFLQFATGSSILPLGGFSLLKPKLEISMTCIYGQQPVAHPTMHRICLSDHPDFDKFHDALLSAISKCSHCQDRPRPLLCPTEGHNPSNNNSIQIIQQQENVEEEETPTFSSSSPVNEC